MVDCEICILDDLGETHSFILDHKLNVNVFEDNLYHLIKSVYLNRKNIWLLCQTKIPYTGVNICI